MFWLTIHTKLCLSVFAQDGIKWIYIQTHSLLAKISGFAAMRFHFINAYLRNIQHLTLQMKKNWAPKKDISSKEKTYSLFRRTIHFLDATYTVTTQTCESY